MEKCRITHDYMPMGIYRNMVEKALDHETQLGGITMRFHDANSDSKVSVTQLKREYLEFADECEEKSFPEYLANVIDATLRGRNDLYLVNVTEDEAYRLMNRIINRWRI